MPRLRYTKKYSEAVSLSRGHSAGNYDNAYVSENFGKAWRGRQERSPEEREYEHAHPIAYKAAYLLGFFGSYENHEIPYTYQDEVIAAEKKYGARMRKQGIGVNRRSWPEHSRHTVQRVRSASARHKKRR